ncbi:MAG: O-antigen ligase family protein, partial [Candidatus Acidiferrales bacterium]
MILILVIDLIVIAVLSTKSLSKGLENALPFATFAIVLLPIETRLSFGFFEMTVQRLIVVVLFVLYFLSPKSQDPAEPGIRTPLKWLMLLHITWCILSTMISIVPAASVKKLVSVVFEYYGLYFVFYKSITKSETIRKILMAMVAAMAVASVFGAYEAYRGWNVVSLLPQVEHRFFFGAGVADMDRDLRVQSTYDHPILFGAALAMAIPFALYYVGTVKKLSQKLYLWGALGLMFLNLYKTGSRGPWLDAILAFILLFVYGGGAVRKRILVIGALSLAVMVLRPGIRDTVYGIYVNTLNTNTNTGASYEYRYALPAAAVRAITRSPARALWGYGLESFYEANVQGMFLGQMYRFLSADNSWAELTVETGFVGLFL